VSMGLPSGRVGPPIMLETLRLDHRKVHLLHGLPAGPQFQALLLTGHLIQKSAPF